MNRLIFEAFPVTPSTQNLSKIGRLAVFLCFGLSLFLVFGSLRMVRIFGVKAVFGASSLLLPATKIDLGAIVAGEEVVAMIPVHNISSSRKVILGAQTSCSCTAVECLPLTIAAGEMAFVTIRYRPKSKGSMQYDDTIPIRLFSGNAEQDIFFDLCANVHESIDL